MSSRQLHIAEPPARYAPRPPLVVDCSVVVGVLFGEHWREAAEQQIAGRALHAPFLLQTEFASVALKKSRQGFQELAERALPQLDDLAIELHPVNVADLVMLGRQYRLSAYDASYLWVAANLRCPLATFDERLGTAARAHLSSLS